jgi:hypothetical protein
VDVLGRADKIVAFFRGMGYHLRTIE